MGSSSEMDLLAELRESLEEEEAALAVRAPVGPARAPRPTAVASPPPLPPRRTGASAGATKSTPVGASTGRPVSPTAPARPGGDPFAEPPEPRLPMGGSPEEKLEFFRVVLKQKLETLGRARGLYAEREAELQALRISEAALRQQVEEAQGKLGGLKELPAKLERSREALAREAARAAAAEGGAAKLRAELAEVEAERQDLGRALAEVEEELGQLGEQLRQERESRGAVAEELIGAKEALALAQERLVELAGERAEMQGALDSVREEYQSTVAELERAEEALGAERQERELVGAERAGLAMRVAQLESALAEVEARTRELEAERDEARSEGAEWRGRLEAAEEELAALRRTLEESEVEQVRLRDQMEADAAALVEAAEQAEQETARLRGELEAVEGERERLREQVARQEAERAEEEALGLEELDAERRAQEAEAQVERLRQRLTMVEGALATARKKAEAQEAAARRGLESRVAQLEAQLEAERARRLELEERVPAGAEVLEPGELLAERDQLKQDVAAMKRKLMAAETAREAAASYKAKLARLEAQLERMRGVK